jgi:hypothetical protein
VHNRATYKPNSATPQCNPSVHSSCVHRYMSKAAIALQVESMACMEPADAMFISLTQCVWTDDLAAAVCSPGFTTNSGTFSVKPVLSPGCLNLALACGGRRTWGLYSEPHVVQPRRGSRQDAAAPAKDQTEHSPTHDVHAGCSAHGLALGHLLDQELLHALQGVEHVGRSAHGLQGARASIEQLHLANGASATRIS